MDPMEERIAATYAAAEARAERLRSLLPEMARRLRARGATSVMAFGSLVTGAQPHEGTDVDLCVWGLDDQARVDALWELEDLAGADVDLVAAEKAPARLIDRVLTQGREIP